MNEEDEENENENEVNEHENENEVNESNEPTKRTEVKKWTPLVLAKLNEKFGAKTNDFIKLLTETGAILSGGFVLQSIVQHRGKPDLDIYVPLKTMPYFLDKLIVRKMFEFREYNHYDATIYCRSFLRKNGIKRVHTFKGNNLMMDIMSVRIARTPEEVCSNFDLTYCQVWFDGITVFATHPEHIENKEGYLQGDYIEPFMKGNTFLKDRLKKYSYRGFKTTYEPTKLKLPSIDSLLTSIPCTRSDRNEEFLYTWFNKVVTKWLTSTNKDEFTVPLGNTHSYTRRDELICSEGIVMNPRDNFPIKDFKVPDDEGYDSEDMDTNKLIKLASKGSNNELVYRRSLFQLLQYSLLSTRQFMYTNFEFIMRYTEYPEKYEPYMDYLRDNCPREGKDMFGNHGLLYDIHSHPLNGAITDESLEKHLEQFYYLSFAEKFKGVSCYYKTCKEKLRIDEIQTILSDEAYNTFIETKVAKLGLNTVIPLYNTILKDEKTDEKTDDFHEAMCPFCLLPVTRGLGGIFMTHDNPNNLPDTEAPYCKKEVVVQSLLDKYKNLAPVIDMSYIEELSVTLEFCVECGRPCIGGQHFDITSAIPKLIQPKRDSSKPGIVFDNTICVGGGRVEMIARMLAVRDVYKYSLIKDPRKERIKAALAADKAPNMKSYIDRATAIFNMESKDRKFNTKVKVVKKYKDPAYKDVVEEKSLSKSINGIARAAHNELDIEEESENNGEQDLRNYREYMLDAGINIDAPENESNEDM